MTLFTIHWAKGREDALEHSGLFFAYSLHKRGNKFEDSVGFIVGGNDHGSIGCIEGRHVT
jgi:hypothetical protein